MDQTGDPELLALASLLSSRARFGVAWLHDDLTVRRTYGALTASITAGAPISDSVLALIGQETRILALATSDDPHLYLANVAVVREDGAPMRLNVSVIYDRKLGFVVVFERVYSAGLAELMVEDEIRKRRIADAELARINRQLEEFAYVISHDLKAPLRALRYFSNDIQEALTSDPLDIEAARTAADSVQLATRRMSNMLVGLLEYSSIGRKEETIATVDTAVLAAEIVDNLALPQDMRVELVGAWPTIRTTPVPLDLVLRNLIDNAIKHHDRERALVRVTATELDKTVQLDIADDGPGIPKEWQEAIFKPFNRMDDRRHPESSGIGLALVKRTVEAVGGRIEVRSDPATARGTTFRVAWPKR